MSKYLHLESYCACEIIGQKNKQHIGRSLQDEMKNKGIYNIMR